MKFVRACYYSSIMAANLSFFSEFFWVVDSSSVDKGGVSSFVGLTVL